MENTAMLEWAARWHYPYLRLGRKDAIRHGQHNWEAFALRPDWLRKELAWKRIERWNELAKRPIEAQEEKEIEAK